MPNRTAVMHPRWHPANVIQFYPDRIAIDARTEVQDPESGESDWAWVPKPGHESIPAALAPAVVSSAPDQENPIDEAIWTKAAWHVALNGYWPDINVLDQLRTIDGRTFNIVGVEHDSHRQNTRLKLEVLS